MTSFLTKLYVFCSYRRSRDLERTLILKRCELWAFKLKNPARGSYGAEVQSPLCKRTKPVSFRQKFPNICPFSVCPYQTFSVSRPTYVYCDGHYGHLCNTPLEVSVDRQTVGISKHDDSQESYLITLI